MTEKVIERGNLSIALFSTKELEVLVNDLKKAGTVETMHYHDNWEWIMPIVEYIEELEEGKFEVVIRKDKCDIYIIQDKIKEILISHKTLNNKILVVWRVIVQFSEWYKKI